MCIGLSYLSILPAEGIVFPSNKMVIRPAEAIASILSGSTRTQACHFMSESDMIWIFILGGMRVL